MRSIRSLVLNRKTLLFSGAMLGGFFAIQQQSESQAQLLTGATAVGIANKDKVTAYGRQWLADHPTFAEYAQKLRTSFTTPTPATANGAKAPPTANGAVDTPAEKRDVQTLEAQIARQNNFQNKAVDIAQADLVRFTEEGRKQQQEIDQLDGWVKYDQSKFGADGSYNDRADKADPNAAPGVYRGKFKARDEVERDIEFNKENLSKTQAAQAASYTAWTKNMKDADKERILILKRLAETSPDVKQAVNANGAAVVALAQKIDEASITQSYDKVVSDTKDRKAALDYVEAKYDQGLIGQYVNRKAARLLGSAALCQQIKEVASHPNAACSDKTASESALGGGGAGGSSPKGGSSSKH